MDTMKSKKGSKPALYPGELSCTFMVKTRKKWSVWIMAILTFIFSISIMNSHRRLDLYRRFPWDVWDYWINRADISRISYPQNVVAFCSTSRDLFYWRSSSHFEEIVRSFSDCFSLRLLFKCWRGEIAWRNWHVGVQFFRTGARAF